MISCKDQTIDILLMKSTVTNVAFMCRINPWFAILTNTAEVTHTIIMAQKVMNRRTDQQMNLRTDKLHHELFLSQLNLPKSLHLLAGITVSTQKKMLRRSKISRRIFSGLPSHPYNWFGPTLRSFNRSTLRPFFCLYVCLSYRPFVFIHTS